MAPLKLAKEAHRPAFCDEKTGTLYCLACERGCHVLVVVQEHQRKTGAIHLGNSP